MADHDRLQVNGPSFYVKRILEISEVVNKVGLLPLLLGVFLLAYFGYLHSPIDDVKTMVRLHDENVQVFVQRRTEADRRVAQTLEALGAEVTRMNRVHQIRLCADVKEADLRRRCLE